MATVNGIDVNNLNGMIEAVKQNPTLAQATFHSHTAWKRGFQSEAAIGDYVQAGATVPRGRSFRLTGDHPEGLLGQNTAPAAVQTPVPGPGARLAGGGGVLGGGGGPPGGLPGEPPARAGGGTLAGGGGRLHRGRLGHLRRGHG